MDVYQKKHFSIEGYANMKTVNMIVQGVLEKHSELKENVLQTIEGLTIYPAEYFCGFDLDVGEYDIRPNTISVHHYAGTWTSQSIKKRIQKMIKKCLGIRSYRTLLTIKRKLFGISGANSKQR